MKNTISNIHRTIALFKPFNVLSQFTSETPGQKTLDEFDIPPNLYPVGRLDRDSEGLLLLSNDGPFIRKLLDPERGHPRIYLAQVENIPSEDALNRLRAGVKIRNGKAHYMTRPASARRIEDEPHLPLRDPPIRYRATIPTAWIELTLTEGKNRQVRKMTAAIGFPTLRLVRIAIGHVTLNGLMPGEWRDISPFDALKTQT